MSFPALAQQACGPRAIILGHLQSNYAESPAAIGLTLTDNVMEVLTSPAGTWTIVIKMPDGTTCMIAAGTDWETIPVAKDRPI